MSEYDIVSELHKELGVYHNISRYANMSGWCIEGYNCVLAYYDDLYDVVSWAMEVFEREEQWDKLEKAKELYGKLD